MSDLTAFLEEHRSTKLYRFAGFRLVSHGAGEAVMECPVGPETQNVNGDLHGGILALLVDEAGTVALASSDRDGRPGVTTDLNVSYLSPGRPPLVRALAKTLKVGKRLGYVQVDIVGAGDGKLIAQGRMTKFMGG
ncbi:MAG: PaaI family thioesterase [Myxococcales bacterium]